MLFPEIRGMIKRWAGHDAPLSLGLKDAVFTTTTEAEFYRKYPHIASILSGGFSSWSGETVSVDSALQHPVVWACRGVVAGTMGYIPTTLRQELPDGDTREAKELPMYRAMKWGPNDELTSQDFRELLTSHAMFKGDGFAQIVRRSGTGTAIQLLHLTPEQVDTGREKTGARRKVYVVKESGIPDKTYPVTPGKPRDIFHLFGQPGWTGMRGFDVLKYARNSIGMALSADRNVSAFWARGGRLPYILEMEKHFKDEKDAEAFRSEWEALYNDPHSTPILENGLKYNTVGASMRDAQSVEFRQAIVAELCRWWDVQPHMVADLSRATFSNIEELALEFEKLTLSKWLKRWNQAFFHCVLTPEEQEKNYYLHHNLDALRRGDFSARMMGYAAALQNGWLSRDEVRALEDRNRIPDGAGQDFTIQLNMQALPLDGVAELAKMRQQRQRSIPEESAS